MSDRESIEFDVLLERMAENEQWTIASKESALDQCIYLFVEGESEEVAFRILLEEGLGIKFEEYGVVIANYNGIGNLKNTIRLMNQTLSHSRPMIFTFDDDNKSLISKIVNLPCNVHLFKVPNKPVVTLQNGDKGGSFEESFEANDFIDACFETTLLKINPQIPKSEFANLFSSGKSFYPQIVNFLKSKGMSSYLPNKIEIAESMATSCIAEPETYVKLAELIRTIRLDNPINVKI
jgi:hypothetical protein